jgi:DNA-binding MarR family transcriptional regulator
MTLEKLPEQTRIRRESVIDFLRENDRYDYNMRDISNMMGYNYNSIKYHVDKLVRDGKIIETRMVSNSTMFQLPEWKAARGEWRTNK